MEATTDITSSSATLNGKISDDGGHASVEARFREKSVASPTWVTYAWQNSLNTDSTYQKAISSLSADTEWEAQTQARFFDGDSLIQETDDAYLSIYSGNWERYGQRIDDFPVCTISSVQFRLLKVGSPGGTGYVRVRKVADDSVIGTLGTVNIADLPTVVALWYTFDDEVVNATEQNIRISFEFDGGDDENYVRVDYRLSDSIDGYLNIYSDSWNDTYTDYDATIRIYRTYSEVLGPWSDSDLFSTRGFVEASASLEGEGSLSATGKKLIPGETSLSGEGSLAIVGQIEKTGQASLSGTGTLTLDGKLDRTGLASLEGTGVLSSEGKLDRTGEASLTGTGTLEATGGLILEAKASFTGEGTLTASGTSTSKEEGEASLTGTGTLSSTGSVLYRGAADLSGEGTLVASGGIVRSGAASLSGEGTFIATGDTAAIQEGSAVLEGTGTLIVTAEKIISGHAAISGEGELLVAAVVDKSGQATLLGVGTLSGYGTYTTTGAASLLGEGTLTVSAEVEEMLRRQIFNTVMPDRTFATSMPGRSLSASMPGRTLTLKVRQHE